MSYFWRPPSNAPYRASQIRRRSLPSKTPAVVATSLVPKRKGRVPAAVYFTPYVPVPIRRVAPRRAPAVSAAKAAPVERNAPPPQVYFEAHRYQPARRVVLATITPTVPSFAHRRTYSAVSSRTWQSPIHWSRPRRPVAPSLEPPYVPGLTAAPPRRKPNVALWQWVSASTEIVRPTQRRIIAHAKTAEVSVPAEIPGRDTEVGYEWVLHAGRWVQRFGLKSRYESSMYRRGRFR